MLLFISGVAYKFEQHEPIWQVCSMYYPDGTKFRIFMLYLN